MFLLLKNISIKVANFSLEIPNLEIERGSYTVILGPSGSGKSTLLETIVGFRKPINGEIYLEGKDITSLPPEKRRIAVVFQDFLLFPHLNVFENIAFGLRKINKAQIREEVEHIASKLKIEHLLNKFPDMLSGGEKQRVALARALVVKPKLLLLDEPFSALDPQTRENLRKLTKEVVKKFGITTLQVSHDFNDAENLADFVIFMKSGRILDRGTFEDFFYRPNHPDVAKFVGLNTLKGKVIEKRNKLCVIELLGNLKFLAEDSGCPKAGTNVYVYIRPELVEVLPSPRGTINTFRARVLDVSKQNFFAKLTLEFSGNRITAIVKVEDVKELPKELYINLKPEYIKVKPSLL